ncbi:MAG: TetR/AcrR family transcriptional regulator [Pseudohongiellaceae bacterium]
MNKPAKLPAPGKREQQKEARRSAIIDAALEEFSAQGFTAAKLDDVAVRAGIGKGTIYLYFDSKESLFEEVVRRNMMPDRDLGESYKASMEGAAADILAQHFRHIYSFMKNDKVPPLLMMILGETARFPKLAQFFYEEMIRPSHELIHHIIRRGIDSGEFRADADRIYTQLLFAPAMHSVIWNLTYGNLAPLDLDNYAETHIDFMLRALRV